jgi:NAD(P)-dependent dehydrogenase (short-subunit alcohol dehydrogenase family)
MLTLIGWIL